jgi:hypothetical protein
MRENGGTKVRKYARKKKWMKETMKRKNKG